MSPEESDSAPKWPAQLGDDHVRIGGRIRSNEHGGGVARFPAAMAALSAQRAMLCP